MKKIILVLCFSLLFLTACGNEAPIVTSTSVEPSVENEVSAQVEILSQLTIEELYSFDTERIKNYFETYIPQYRDIFLIEKDHVMVDADWITLRDILSMRLFGTTKIDKEDENITDADKVREIIVDNYSSVSSEEKTEIQDYMEYGFISSEEILLMPMDKFQDFFYRYYVWAIGSDEGYQESFGSITTEQWSACQKSFAEEMKDGINLSEK